MMIDFWRPLGGVPYEYAKELRDYFYSRIKGDRKLFSWAWKQYLGYMRKEGFTIMDEEATIARIKLIEDKSKANPKSWYNKRRIAEIKAMGPPRIRRLVKRYPKRKD